MGKLAPDKWKDQDLSKIFDNATISKGTATGATVAERDAASAAIAIADAAQETYDNFNDKNKDKVKDNMTGKNYAAGKTYGAWT